MAAAGGGGGGQRWGNRRESGVAESVGDSRGEGQQGAAGAVAGSGGAGRRRWRQPAAGVAPVGSEAARSEVSGWYQRQRQTARSAAAEAVPAEVAGDRQRGWSADSGGGWKTSGSGGKQRGRRPAAGTAAGMAACGVCDGQRRGRRLKAVEAAGGVASMGGGQKMAAGAADCGGEGDRRRGQRL